MQIKFVAQIKNPLTHDTEYEIVAKTASKLVAVLLQLKHESGFNLSAEKLLNHLFEGGPNGTGSAYCCHNICITVSYE